MADGSTTTSFFPSGTTLLFYQAAAPTGWTQVTTHDNKALRVVSGTGGGSGGSTAFTSVFASRTVPLVDHNHTASGTMADHTHGGVVTSTILYNANQARSPILGYPSSNGFGTGSTGTPSDTSVSVSISNASATQSTGNTMDFAVQYIDVILCSKN